MSAPDPSRGPAPAHAFARRSVLSSGGAALALRLLGRLVAYGFALVVARLAGPEAWGQFSLALAVVSIGAILAVTGFDTAMTKLAAASGTRVVALLRPVLALTAVQGVLVGAGAWALAPQLAEHVFGDAALTGPFRWAAVAVLPVAVQHVLARTLNGLSYVATTVLYQQVLRFVVPMGVWLVMALATWTSGTVASDVVISYVVGNALLLVPLGRSVRVAFARSGPGHAPALGSLRAVYALSLPLFLASSMGFVKGWADTILVGVYLDQTQVGIYDIAFRVGSAIGLPLWAASAIASPLIAAASARGDDAGVESAARAAAAMATVLAAPAAVALLAAPELFMGLFGAEFVAGAASLRWIALGYLVNAWAGVGGVAMTMAGLHKAYQVVVLGSTAFSIGANVVLLPRMGIEGAALSTFLGLLVFNGITVLAVRRWAGIWVVCRLTDAVDFVRDPVHRLRSRFR